MKLNDELGQLLIKESNEIEEELIFIRRHLHSHPELSFKEYETSKYIMGQLDKIGIPYKRIGETGVVAWIDGMKDKEVSSSFTIGLRADIDALPIQEETGHSFSSLNEGVMHACGHDGHTTILLGAARLLYQNKKYFSGKVVCIFQPGEEEDGAAKEMIRLGVLKNPKIDAMVGLHLWPYIPFGKIGIKSGSMTASCDDFTIRIKGKGGHGARPYEGVDAIAVSQYIMQGLQHLVVKTTNPLNPIIIHVGKIMGGSARNVIADEVVMEGTTRALTNKDRELLEIEVKRIVEDITQSFHAKAEVNYVWGHSPIKNDLEMTNIVDESVREQWGDGQIVNLEEPSLGADDFGEFSQQVPSCYFRLGIKKEGEETYNLHHPKFSFDEKVLSRGAATFAYIALKAINKLGE
ncbi:M20 metallopeptidase family protein [Virgibacillus kimchii]